MSTLPQSLISDDLLDALFKNYEKPEDFFGTSGILEQLTKRVVERALQAELAHHLGHDKNSPVTNSDGNTRNGRSRKTLKGQYGPLEIDVPRDRRGSFEPQLVQKHQTHWQGFDDQVISLYSRGMTVREIQGHLSELYKVDVSPALISAITSEVAEDVKAWQNRPLDAVYPIVYLDCMHVKVRDAGSCDTKAVYIALGVNMEGRKEVLGLWMSANEGAKFWLSVVTEIQQRGVQDIFIACVDGLKGFPEAIESVFPRTEIQICIVHMVRNSLRFVSWKQRKVVAAGLKNIYTSPTVQAASDALCAFESTWGAQFPLIGKSWRANWDRLITFFKFPEAIRKVIYTTNAIESLNMSLRKIIKNRASFPNDEAVFKLLWLALNRISLKWSLPIKDWNAALNCFAILFEDRVKLEK